MNKRTLWTRLIAKLKPPTRQVHDRYNNPLTAPLETACKAGDIQSVDRILNQQAKNPPVEPFFPFLPTFDFMQALAIAIQHHHPEIVSRLLKDRVPFSEEALYRAVETRSIEIFEILVNDGLDLDDVCCGLWDALHPRFWNFAHPPFLACILDSEKLLSWCLANGASPNAANRTGIVPLNAAAAAKYPLSSIRFLVENGADVKCSNALQIVAGAPVEMPEVERLEILTDLLAHGADIDAFEYAYHEEGFHYHAALTAPAYREDGEGLAGSATALHRAAEGGLEYVVRFLLERGANPALRVKYIFDGFWSVDRLDRNRILHGRTAKEIAEVGGYEDVAVVLEEWEKRFCRCDIKH